MEVTSEKRSVCEHDEAPGGGAGAKRYRREYAVALYIVGQVSECR